MSIKMLKTIEDAICFTKLKTDKLNIEIRPDVTPAEPIMGHKYTLTHSDITADLFLTKGLQFVNNKANIY